ncbi:hypothetical protein [Phenylobacterium sp. SCN 70-31]|uniref:hypothetical protein n=1 Tax=Phenylobacterium sp. SCN 70-31 TaxID=1660129 RepID=UPI0025DBBA9B|nr:hypothetical protein [Phenylobacterium sp. SCN 70-31]
MPSIASLDRRCFLEGGIVRAEAVAPGRAPPTLVPPAARSAPAGLQPGPARQRAEPAAA